MLIHAIHIDQFADLSNASDSWHARARRYDVQAAHDLAMYQWLALRGMLPAPGKAPGRRAMRAWRRSREYRVISQSKAGAAPA